MENYKKTTKGELHTNNHSNIHTKTVAETQNIQKTGEISKQYFFSQEELIVTTIRIHKILLYILAAN